tara:strand:+ start:753 stop:1058 length:306 start_codon:yes stop_codon:yes gene_type:complete
MSEYTLEGLKKELSAGIVEIVYIDQYSVEYTISATRSENHLNEDVSNSFDDEKHLIAMWNLIEEKWTQIPVSSIIHMERLTGIGVKSDDDLVDPTLLNMFS